MHQSRILEFILLSLALRGFILTFITSIGNPLEDFDNKAILSRYVSVINYLKERVWRPPFQAFHSMFESLGYWKVFFCGYCLNVWLSIPLFIYYINHSDIYIALIFIGVNFLIINKIK
jgi:hypothetical protein